MPAFIISFPASRDSAKVLSMSVVSDDIRHLCIVHFGDIIVAIFCIALPASILLYTVGYSFVLPWSFLSPSRSFPLAFVRCLLSRNIIPAYFYFVPCFAQTREGLCPYYVSIPWSLCGNRGVILDLTRTYPVPIPYPFTHSSIHPFIPSPICPFIFKNLRDGLTV